MSNTDSSQNGIKWMRVTHSGRAEIGEGRFVKIDRGEDGSFQFEWSRPEDGNGNAVLATKIVLSEEAAMQTFMLFAEMASTISPKQDEQEGGAS